MSYLQLNPNSAPYGADRPMLAPVLPLASDVAGNPAAQARALRRRLGAMRIRGFDAGLRPFRII
jgi:hypothetical protein